VIAHVAGVPVEELLVLAPAAGALWLALRDATGLGQRARGVTKKDLDGEHDRPEPVGQEWGQPGSPLR
jgi:hypothetical protein